MPARPPLPPFTMETAHQKVRAAEDVWNSRDPARVALAYTPGSIWRHRTEFFQGHDAIVAFLRGISERELDYVLRKSHGRFTDDRIAARSE